MIETPTVTVHFSHAIVAAATQLGLDIPATLATSIAERERVDLADQDRLWEQLCAASNNPLIGLELGLQLQMANLDATGMILMSCDSVGEALRALLEYQPIISEGSRFDLRTQTPPCQLRYEPAYQVRRAARVELVMASLLHLTRWATGEAFVPLRVAFRHQPLASAGRYRELLRTEVTFGAPDNALLFAREELDRPLIHANPNLYAHLCGLADQLLEQLGSDSLSAQVGVLVQAQPRWGKERVASELGMSGRHLTRRLASERTSFKFLRDTLLMGQAKRALAQGRRLTDIAAELGFSDESAFAKTFKRWTGQTPTGYRAHD